jgi:hypothetical protein
VLLVGLVLVGLALVGLAQLVLPVRSQPLLGRRRLLLGI